MGISVAGQRRKAILSLLVILSFAGGVIRVTTAAPGRARAEVRATRPCVLQPGEPTRTAVTRCYGDKYYLWVLEKHLGRKPGRGAHTRLPSLHQLLKKEGVFERAPSASALVLEAQSLFHRLTSGGGPGCDRPWRQGDRAMVRQAAAKLGDALDLLGKLTPRPRSMISQLKRARASLRWMSSEDGDAAGLCKAHLEVHKRFARALTACIDWARGPR